MSTRDDMKSPHQNDDDAGTNEVMEEEKFIDCKFQSLDVLALHGLDDDDTTQSSKSSKSMIKEDLSFVFDEEDYESIYEDANDKDNGDSGIDDGDSREQQPRQPQEDEKHQQEVALWVFQSAKGLWSRGKDTFGIGMVLGVIESVCCTVAKTVTGVANIENDLVKPKLQFVDEGLQPAYAAISNAWNAARYPEATNNNSNTKPIFQIEFPESFGEADENNWIPLEGADNNNLSRLDSLDKDDNWIPLTKTDLKC